jgi:hypothetical protein
MNNDPDFDDESEDVDIHGKLAHFDSIGLSPLKLNERYAWVTLLYPCNTDDFGRMSMPSGTLPNLPALEPRELRKAMDGLEGQGLLRKWVVGDNICIEIAGAYGFKPNLKRLIAERTQLAIKKREERQARRQRKKDLKEGLGYALNDDGKGPADEGTVTEVVRTTRGNHVPMHHGVWFRSNVPMTNGMKRMKMLMDQPDTADGICLKMLPSFNPGSELGVLAAVLRYYLHRDCDDYGRVRIDIDRLHAQLGPQITKRISKAKIKSTLEEMIRQNHLNIFRNWKRRGDFAYLLDSAQHLKRQKLRNRDIPRLYADPDFTLDSPWYRAFFEGCRAHSMSRKKVYVGQYAVGGNLTVISEYVDTAGKHFVEQHNRMLLKEPYSSMTVAEFCGLEESLGFQTPDFRNQFWRAIQDDLGPDKVFWLYKSRQDEFDGTGGVSPDTHVLFTHLLGMPPADFIARLLANAGRSHAEPISTELSVTPIDCFEPPLIVPQDDDFPLSVPHNELSSLDEDDLDEVPEVVPD